MEYFFWLLVAFALFKFFYFAKIFLKYEYSFEELKEMIYQLELRLERLSPSEIEHIDYKREELLAKGFINKYLTPIRTYFLSIQFKAYYDDNLLYMELFEEYFQRIKEYRKFTLILVIGLVTIFSIGFLMSRILV